MATEEADKELATFLAHSVELESEARERYEELADAMAQHHNDEVAGFFRRMAQEAALHLAEVSEIAAEHELPELKAWEFNWPDVEPPETASYESVHYRMSLREAMTLALGNERAARDYYAQAADWARHAQTVTVAQTFAEEETAHAAQLEAMIAELADNGALHRVEDDEPHMPE